MVKIGIIRTSSIGDLVLATSCISLLRQILPGADLLWLGMNPSLSLLKESYPKIECVEIDRNLKIKDIVDQLSEVDFLLDLQMNLRSRIVSHAFKNKYKRPIFTCAKRQLQRNRLILESRIYGRRRELPSRALETLKFQYVQMRDALLLALESMKLVEKHISIHNEACVPHLPLDHFEDKKELFERLKGLKWIAISPGASYETKRAPLSLFIDPLKRMDNGTNSIGLIFLGDKNDAVVCEELKSNLNWKGPVLDLAGQLSLWENAAVLNRCMFLISNDSSLGHIAEAVDTPVLIFFGPTVEGFGFAPRKKESKAFSSKLGCRPCSKHGKTVCRFGDKLCFHQINTEDVYHHMTGILQSKDFR